MITHIPWPQQTPQGNLENTHKTHKNSRTLQFEGSDCRLQQPLGLSEWTGSRKSNLKKTSSHTKKVILQRDLRTHHVLFFFALGVPEVLIMGQIVRILNGKAFEFVIIAHFVGGGHFVRTDGDRLAVNFDGANGVHEAVELEEVLGWGLDFD